MSSLKDIDVPWTLRLRIVAGERRSVSRLSMSGQYLARSAMLFEVDSVCALVPISVSKTSRRYLAIQMFARTIADFRTLISFPHGLRPEK